MKKFIVIFLILFSACSQKPSERCHPATTEQLDFIKYAVEKVQDSNYIKDGYSVKSNDFQNVYMVAVKLYGPGLENGVGPAVFAVGGDPDQPHTWLAVDGYAREFTDLPVSENTEAMITLSSDGVDEVKSCFK